MSVAGEGGLVVSWCGEGREGGGGGGREGKGWGIKWMREGMRIGREGRDRRTDVGWAWRRRAEWCSQDCDVGRYGILPVGL